MICYGKLKKLSALAALLSTLALAACDKHNEPLQGYIENNLTHISSPVSGQLAELKVGRGSNVKQGQHLFTLEQQPELDDVKHAQADAHKAFSMLSDLQKGKRPSEIARINAQIHQTDASLKLAKKEWVRQKKLLEKNHTTESSFDKATENVKRTEAKLNELKSSLTTAQLPARIDQINAANAQLHASESLLRQAKWALSKKTVNSPIDARVFNTFYRKGEEVPAGSPLLSLLTPTNTKAIFFVPEARLSQIKLGSTINITCSSCPQAYKATINFISDQAEYTPPVIYSQKTREHLVYRVKAIFPVDIAKKLHPGQAIDVTL